MIDYVFKFIYYVFKLVHTNLELQFKSTYKVPIFGIWYTNMETVFLLFCVFLLLWRFIIFQKERLYPGLLGIETTISYQPSEKYQPCLNLNTVFLCSVFSSVVMYGIHHVTR